ncbi:Vesicle-associated protein 1-4 [Cardamine amara subsp. amara]|uniref:Vesicle-associated protein 1-4 n=1 Tax=Cardamine amara subsp. amara TaxID=228776 RepID=A0ABD1C0E3_CARAN
MDGRVKPPNIQVFINFRGEQLRTNFVGHLVDALRRSEINVFIDNQEQRGEDLTNLFKRIKDSGIAIALFSSRYTESKWCLEELVKIKERADKDLLKVLPIFYKVTPENVKRLKGEFGDHFRDKEHKYASEKHKIKQWRDAISYVSQKFGLAFDENSSVLESDFIETIVKEILKILQAMSTVESGQSSR